MFDIYFVIGQVLTDNILKITLQTIEVWNRKRHWTIILGSYIKHCFIFLFLLHYLPATPAQQHPHNLLASHLQLQLVCAHPPSNLQSHDLVDLQAFWEEHLQNYLDIDCEHQSLNLPDQRQVILHWFAFQLHTQHPLCQHRTSSSWSSMSPSSQALRIIITTTR